MPSYNFFTNKTDAMVRKRILLPSKWQGLPTVLLQPMMYTYYQQKLLQLHYQADNVTWRQDIIYVTGMAIKSNRKSNKSLLLVSLGSISSIQPWSILDEVVRDAVLGSDLKAGGTILTSAPSNRGCLCCLLLGTRLKTFQGEIFPAWNMELGMKVLTLAYSLEAL